MTSRLGRLAVVALASLLPGQAGVAADLYQRTEVGGWSIAKVPDEHDVPGCAAKVMGADGSAIGFIVRAGAHDLVVHEPAARLAGVSQVAVTYRVDAGPAVTRSGSVVRPTIVAVRLPLDEVDATYRAFRQGSTLFLQMDGQAYEERLDSVAGAMDALAACYQSLPPP